MVFLIKIKFKINKEMKYFRLMKSSIKKKYFINNFISNSFFKFFTIYVLIFILIKPNYIMGMNNMIQRGQSSSSKQKINLRLSNESAKAKVEEFRLSNNDNYYDPMIKQTIKSIKVDLFTQKKELKLMNNSIRELKKIYSSIEINIILHLIFYGMDSIETVESENFIKTEYLNENFNVSYTIDLSDLLESKEDGQNKVKNSEKIGMFRWVFDDRGMKIETIDQSNLYREREQTENIFDIWIDSIEIIEKDPNKIIFKLFLYKII